MTVSLASLTIFLVPLIALLLSHDAIAGEAERGTLLLLLAYPVSRTAVILGKFAGQLAILAVATIIGYGVAAVAVGWNLGAASWAAFAAMIGASILLGAVFLALGPPRQHARPPALDGRRHRHRPLAPLRAHLRHGLSRPPRRHRRPQPAAAASSTRCSPSTRPTPIACSPSAAAGAGGLTGIGALAGHTALTPPLLVAVLLAWTAAPLALAALVFSRREL